MLDISLLACTRIAFVALFTAPRRLYSVGCVQSFLSSWQHHCLAQDVCLPIVYIRCTFLLTGHMTLHLTSLFEQDLPIKQPKSGSTIWSSLIPIISCLWSLPLFTWTWRGYIFYYERLIKIWKILCQKIKNKKNHWESENIYCVLLFHWLLFSKISVLLVFSPVNMGHIGIFSITFPDHSVI